MQRRRFLTGCACCGVMGASRLASAQTERLMPPRLSRPEAGTDEGGLWALLDREEAKLKRSTFLVRDPAINQYIHDIACRLAGDHCPDLRVYIVREPNFNATMAPNGMLQVWTGLLLRVTNEAQLAAVLGHEIGHYVARHTVDRLRDAKSRSAFAQFLGAFGLVGAIAQLAVLAGSFAFSREQESEADRIGLNLMDRAGYAPIEASKVWKQLLEDLKAEKDWSGDAGGHSVLFASHPLPENREASLAAAAAELQHGNAATGDTAYRAVLAPHRRALLEDELRRRKFGESLALLQRLQMESNSDAELAYFLGEAYRLRGADGDQERALTQYRQTANLAGAPAETYRAMGTIYQHMGNQSSATEAFRQYLAAKPDAADLELIQSYIKEGIAQP